MILQGKISSDFSLTFDIMSKMGNTDSIFAMNTRKLEREATTKHLLQNSSMTTKRWACIKATMIHEQWEVCGCSGNKNYGSAITTRAAVLITNSQLFPTFFNYLLKL